MVIAHESLSIGAISKEYHAVVLCGNAAAWCKGLDEELDEKAQLQAERLISLSENVTHDRVTEQSKRPEFQSWVGAKSAIRKLRGEVRRLLKETVAKQVEAAEGAAAPMFGLDFGNEGPPQSKRVLSIQNLELTSEADDSFYRATFRILLPRNTDEKLLKTTSGEGRRRRYSRWRVEIPCNFVQEDGYKLKGVRGKVLEFGSMVKKLDGTVNHEDREKLVWATDDVDVPWIEGEFFDEERYVDIELETERMPDSLASFGRLQVKTTTKLGGEVVE